jgi:hypothetical protein
MCERCLQGALAVDRRRGERASLWDARTGSA